MIARVYAPGADAFFAAAPGAWGAGGEKKRNTQ